MPRDDGIAYDAFVDGADLPTRAELLSGQALGASQRDLIEALLAHDVAQVSTALDRDPMLARIEAAARTLLEIAVATGEPALVAAVAAGGAPLDGSGDGAPLSLALHACAPELAFTLLDAGANPTPPGAPLEPLRSAIALGSAAGVRLLLDFGAAPDVIGPLGRRPLHIALDMERFTLAELLIDRGADLWAIDASGANLGTAVTTPMVTDDPAERAAQLRLSRRALTAGWPDPVPTPHQLLADAAAGRWPPARR